MKTWNLWQLDELAIDEVANVMGYDTPLTRQQYEEIIKLFRAFLDAHLSDWDEYIKPVIEVVIQSQQRRLTRR